MDINILISNPDYFSELLAFPEISGIYIEEERTDTDQLRNLIRGAHKAGKRLYLALPYIWNTQSGKNLERVVASLVSTNIDGYLVRNLDELGLIDSLEATGDVILDAGMYTWNKAALRQLQSAGATRFTAPYELNKHELLERGFENTELVVYGAYPMMISNGCLRLTTGKCVKETDPYGVYKLKDRTGTFFSAVNCCRYCYNIIYNSVPTWLLDEPDIDKVRSLRFSFTTESRQEMRRILTEVFAGNLQAPARMTRGHYKRGAE